MKRSWLLFALPIMLAWACNAQKSSTHQEEAATFVNEKGETIERLQLTEDAWQKKLTSEEFSVLRQQGTERAFTGDLWDNKAEGVYTCAGCGLPLFASDTKFESGTGWPSFYEPIDETHVDQERDATLGMLRTEVHCNKCGGHLGHVFDDGPKPTGLRYCINSVSLDFQKGQ